jgi:cell division protein FtsQ
LRDGPQLRLGADSIDLRLERALMALDELAGESGTEIAYLDLRYPNGFAVAWRNLNTTAHRLGGSSP